jgi:hypothetical protein
MATMQRSDPRDARSVPLFWPVVAIGGLIGYLLSGDPLEIPPPVLVTSYGLGLVWAYLLIQWVDMLGEALSFHRNPVPLLLDLGDREVVRAHLGKVKGGQLLARRARNLLQAWTLSWNPTQMVELASFQSRQAARPLRAGSVFAAMLLFVCYQLNANPWLTWGGIGLLGLTVFARQILVQRIDEYLESHLLTRLPAHFPGTAMTAADLAGALGGSIHAAFKDHVPQPEQTAAAMKAAVEDVVKNVASEVAKLEKTLVSSQASLVEKWSHASSMTTTDLKNVEKALATVVTDLTGGLSNNAEKLKTMFSSHTHDMDSSLSGAVEEIGKAGAAWGGHLKGVTGEHAEKLQAATQAIAAQLDKIMALEQDIQKVLHIQEVVDGTLKSVAATDEFKKTLEALRTHIEASDNLLREVAKPKTIRLVETDEDEKAGSES